MTPIEFVVSCGREIDKRFPGLRERNADQWMAKVVFLASQTDPRIGRKSNHGIDRAISVDSVGILPGGDTPVTLPHRRVFQSVSIIRDNPPINEWRPQPHDYGPVEQFWIKAEPVDLGDGQAPGNGEEPGDGGSNPGPGAILEALRAEVQRQKVVLDTLTREALRYGDKVGLRTENGHVLCAEGGGGGDVHSDRTEVLSWETFTVERPA